MEQYDIDNEGHALEAGSRRGKRRRRHAERRRPQRVRLPNLWNFKAKRLYLQRSV